MAAKDSLITIRLPRPLKDWLRTKASENGIAASEALRAILRHFKKKEEAGLIWFSR